MFTADSSYFFQKTNVDVKRGTVGGNGVLTLFSDLQEFMVQKASGRIQEKRYQAFLFCFYHFFLPLSTFGISSSECLDLSSIPP